MKTSAQVVEVSFLEDGNFVPESVNLKPEVGNFIPSSQTFKAEVGDFASSGLSFILKLVNISQAV